jgi:mevalonate kinase
MTIQQITVSAPGKFILFGEHAVVYGEPALALAIDLRMTVTLRESTDGQFTVNGRPLEVYKHRYIKKAVELFYDGPPLTIRSKSTIPNAAGLGSSAAITTAMVGALMQLQGTFTEEELARNAYKVEYGVQGMSSPTDTSVSSHGNSILLTSEPQENHLWTIKQDDHSWSINHIDVPDLTIVIGHTRTGANTPKQVAMVRRFVESNAFAKDVVHDIGKITVEGAACLRRGDKERLGELMNRNHDLLTILGINTRRLQDMVDKVQSHSYGAKLTGAGGGGCIIALTDEPEKVSDAVERLGGIPFIVKTTKQGFMKIG